MRAARPRATRPATGAATGGGPAARRRLRLGGRLRAVVLFALIVAAFGVGAALRRGLPALEGAPRAVLIDQMAADDPRTDFRDGVVDALGAAGYRLTVVSPAEATVRRFQALPADRARLIIVRAHAALILDGDAWTDDVALFTNEPVDLDRYAVTGLAPTTASAPPEPAAPPFAAGGPTLSSDELAALVPVRRLVGDDRRPLLGIGARFVRDHLRGRFASDTVIVLMGCDSLRGRALSEAFLARGAGSVIGWSDQVSAGHTDRATAALVAALARGASVAEALRDAMASIGPDPETGAQLVAAVR